MIEPTISLCRFFAYLAWAFVALLVFAAWIVLGLGHPNFAALLGFTGCASSAVAVVLTIRCWVTRVCGLIRLLHADDLPPEERRRLVPMR